MNKLDENGKKQGIWVSTNFYETKTIKTNYIDDYRHGFRMSYDLKILTNKSLFLNDEWINSIHLIYDRVDSITEIWYEHKAFTYLHVEEI